LLQLAEELNNEPPACRILGYPFEPIVDPSGKPSGLKQQADGANFRRTIGIASEFREDGGLCR